MDEEGGALDVLLPTPVPSPSPVPDLPEPAEQDTAPQREQDTRQPDVRGGEVSGNDGRGIQIPTGSVVSLFLEGYRHGGGESQWEEHLMDVIQCESSWRLDPPGIHLGLAQFTPRTWEKARCSIDADYRNPFDQGCAVARWMRKIKPHYGTKAGWPHCW